ncbi:hypothetical protein ACHQM5_002397 [Ranunculus cassubicifolius]
MGSLTTSKLPIIDFSGDESNPGSSSWVSKQSMVRKAIEEFGCFEAFYDKVPLEAHKEMYGVLEDLFSLPVETKRKNINEIMNFGYMGPNQHTPLYEGLGIGDSASLEKVLNFTNLMWPEGNPNFCETTHSYVHRLMRLEQMVKRMIFESFGLEKYFDSNNESVDYLLRVIVYRPQKNVCNGLTAHTDKCFLTILHQNGVDGLQIQNKDNEWITLTPSPLSFIVMIGESFMAWSNGRLQSPYHRVIMNEMNTRYSIALFSYSKGMVETAEELVDEEHPLMFNPFDAKDLLRFYFNEKGYAAGKYTINAYCSA